MVTNRSLETALDDLLDSSRFTDYGPNGLQVEGRPEINRVITAVTASLRAIEAAVAGGADALVVHHGIFWNHQSPVLRGHHLKRVRALLEAGVNLYAYHLPLDHHPEVGNNAPVLRGLGVEDLEPFAEAKGATIGWKGRLPEPRPAAEFLSALRSLYGLEETAPLHAFLEGPDPVRSVGICSGGAQGALGTAIAEGLDAFVTGEISEYNLHLAREEGIHHVSVGHHVSERIGPRLLADWLEREQGLEARFLDFPNPA